VVEDLSYHFSEGKPLTWTPEIVNEAREQVLDELLRERDTFVHSNETIIIETLESSGLTIIDDEEIEAAHPAPVAPSAQAHSG
jgi:hypothetical protein